MGSNISKNVEYNSIDNIDRDFKQLISESKNLLNSCDNTHKDLKFLIENDINILKEFLNKNYNITMSLSGNDYKIQELLKTFFSDKIESDLFKYNIITNNQKGIYSYKEKLKESIENYKDDSLDFNIYNRENTTISKRKLIFSKNLNENNIISDEIIISIPPIFQNNSNYRQLKMEINLNSKDYSEDDKIYLDSAEFNEFLFCFQNYENKLDSFMKFIFMTSNHDINLYIVDDDLNEEIKFFNLLVSNHFFKSLVKNNKLIIVTSDENNFYGNKNQFNELITRLNIKSFSVNFKNCQKDKLYFLSKLILKKDERSFLIPEKIKEELKDIILYEINIQYQKIYDEHQKKLKKLEDENKRKLELENEEKKLQEAGLKNKIKKIFNSTKEKKIEIISKEEFTNNFINNLDDKFITSSKIDTFEENLYNILYEELLNKQYIFQSYLIFKCSLLRSLKDDKDNELFNLLNEKRNVIVESIDQFNSIIDNTLKDFVGNYHTEINNYIITLEQNIDYADNESNILDIFSNGNFSSHFKEIILQEKKFENFENKNISNINILSNFIYEKSNSLINDIAKQYTDLTQLSIEKSLNDFSSYKNSEKNKILSMDNCKVNINKVILNKLNSFNLIHLILFNHYGHKNIHVKKPEIFYRYPFYIGTGLSCIFGMFSLIRFFSWKTKISTGLFSITTFCLGLFFSNLLKKTFINNSKKFLKGNKFVLSKYLKIKLTNNDKIYDVLMKYFKKISEESLELMNALVSI